MPLDPALKPLLDALAENPMHFEKMTPEQARAAFEQSSALFPAPPPVDLASTEDRTIPGPGGEIPLRIYRARAEGALPTLVYFHGGGWVVGGLDSHDASCRGLAAGADCMVVSVDYRLAPEHPYPAPFDDCYQALCWVFAHADEIGADPARIAVGGDSAGGNLAAATALKARAENTPPLVFQLLIYPVTEADFTRASYRENGEGYFLTRAAMQWFWGHYAPEDARRREPYCAPLAARELGGLPPALVQTAEFDPLRDEGEAYARRMKEDGTQVTLTRYDGMIHGYFMLTEIVPAAAAAQQEAVQALRKAFEVK